MTSTVLLGDVIKDIAMGPFGSNLKVESFTETGVPVVKGQNLTGHKVAGEFSYVTEEKAQSLKRSIAHPEDIVITHRGTLGQVSIVPRDEHPYYLVSQSQLRITPDKNKVNPMYLLYYLRSNIGQRELFNHTSQVGVPSIATPTRAVRSFRVTLPDIESQTKIVNILSTIDEKIELNRKMNETLEQIGYAIFRDRFIDNPESAKWGLADISKFADNIRNTAKPPFGDSTKYVALEHFTPQSLTLYSHSKATDVASNKSVFVKKDILFGKLRPYFHKVVVAPFNGVCSTDVLVIRPISEIYTGYVSFFMSQSSLIKYVTQASEGTRMPRTSWGNICSYKMRIPPDSLLKEFEDISAPLIEAMINNAREINVLIDLRDSLLPRLIDERIKL